MARRLQLRLPVEAARSVQLWLTLAAVALPPLLFGSVDQVSVALWTGLLSISMLCGFAEPLSRNQGYVVLVFLALCGSYLLVAFLQICPGLFGSLNDPYWQKAGALLGLDLSPRISSRAELPRVAIGHFLLLVTSFLSGFFTGTSRRSADTLVLTARYSILVYALYGLFALALTPNLVLWSPKLAYRGSLTATFINHNTAATLIGAGLILWSCTALQTLQSLGRVSSIRLLLLIPSNEHIGFKIVVRAAAALVCLFALLLTGSRGGLICSCLGLLLALMLMISNRFKLGIWYGLALGGIALAMVVAWLSQTGAIATKGIFDDGRWSVYGLCLDAIRQHPYLGAGAGTFADLFPSLRTGDFKSWGVWDYAHSTILEIAVEMGVPIALMVTIGCVASLFILIRAALQSSEHSRSLLSAISGIAVLSYLHSAIDFSLQIPGYLIPFTILLGCALARATSERKPDLASKTSLAGPASIETGPVHPEHLPSTFAPGTQGRVSSAKLR
jgi:O-antigen ligase